MPKYLSGRVKRTDQAYLSTDRYQYLGLEQAEPNLADPPAGGTSSGIPVGQRSQIISVQGFPGERFWVPVEGGLIPGSISVFEEGTLVGGSSSTTQLDFKGNIITAIGNRTGLSNPGVAVTLSVDPPGTDGQLLFNKNGDFGASTLFNYDDSTVGVASVGIGTSSPTQNLHILGNLRLENSFFDATNFSGNAGQLLVRNASGGLEYANASTVPTGAGGTFGNVQFHDDTGLVDGASNFVFDESTSRVGIGSTQPTVLLDVVGISSFSNLTIAGVLTASQEQGGLDFETDVRFEGANYNAEWDISESALEFEDNAKVKFGSDLSKELEIFFDGTHSKIDHTSATGSLFLAGDSLILSNSGMSQYYLQAAENGSVLLNHSGITKFQTAETGAVVTGIFTATEEIRSAKITTIDNNFVNIDVSGIATMGTIDTNFVDAENIDVGFATVTDKLNVTGFTTTKNIFAAGVGTFLQLQVDNVKIDGNKVESTTGNLILESVTNTITANDILFVNNADDSTSKDSGSIITQGGVGIEKSLNVGNNLSVVGFTTLASDGGITTTGGDLYIGGDLYVDDDIVLDNINAGSVYVSGISTFVGLSTFNDGISVESGLSTFRGDVFVAAGATVGLGDSVFIPDDKKIIFGDDNDFSIAHDSLGYGGTKLINDSGQLLITSDDLEIRSTTDDKPYLTATVGSATTLYHNANIRIETTNEGVKVTGITSMTDNLKVGQYVESNLTPSDNQNYNLGENGKSWDKLYIKEIIGTDSIGVDESTIGNLTVTGIATIATLGVTGLTTTKDLIVTGLSTFKGNSHFESNVGIGTDDPDTDFHVFTHGSVLVSLFESETHDSRLRIKAPSNKYSQIEFSDDDADTGEIRYDHTDDSMQFFVNSNDEKLRITSGGGVGIGTTNPGVYKLHVQSPIATIARFERTTDSGGGSWAKVDIKSGTSSGNSYLTFSDVDATEIGAINYEHNNDSLIFHVNGGDKVTIDSSGNVLRGGTGQDIGTNSAPWDKIYANEFLGQVGESQGNLEVGNLLVTGISTFRDSIFIGTGATVGFGTTAFFPDDAKIIFGDDDDFQISHTNSLANQIAADGNAVTAGNQTASLIQDAGPGPTIFKSNGGGGPGCFQFFDVNWRPLIRMYSGGTQDRQVSLYYNSERRLATNSLGVEIEGRLGIGIDNPTEKLHVSSLGATDEPTIKISSENSSIFLRTAGSGGSFPTGGGGNDGELVYLGGDFRFGIGGSGSHDLVFFNGDGYPARLTIDPSGNLLRGGTGQDIGANGSPWDKVYANEFVGQINVTQSELTVTNLDVLGIATFRDDVQFHSSGSTSIRFDSSVSSLKFATDAKAVFGADGDTAGDLQIYSNASHSYITHANSTNGSHLYIESSDNLILQHTDGNNWIRGINDGATELYWNLNGSVKLKTQSTGIDITGELITDTAKVSNLTDGRVVLAGSQGKLEDSANLTFVNDKLTILGDLLVTGDATYEGVTNIDSVGIVTAGKGFRATTGGLVVTTGISTFNDVIRPLHGNSESSGIQWANDIGSGGGDKGYIRYYVESGENTRLEIANLNDADDDIFLNTKLVNVSDDLTVDENLIVSGNTTLGNATDDTVTFNARVDSNIYPSINASATDPLTNGYDLGGSNNQWRKVFAREFSGAVIGNADTATRLATSRIIAITGDLGWSVDFDGSQNVSGTGTLATTGVTANTYGSGTQIPRITVDAKGRITAATTNGLDLTGATANSANKIKINDTNADQDFYLTFVTDSGNEKDVYIDGQLKYNPVGNVLTTRNIFPESDDTYDLGRSDTQSRWNNVWAQHFRGGTFHGTIADTVSTFSLDTSVDDIFSVSSNILSADDATADKIVFYDNSTDKLRYLSIGSNLSINGTTLDGTGDTDTTYSLPLSGDANAVSFNLTSSTGSVDGVTITKGSGITFSTISNSGFTINAATQSGTTYNLGTRTSPAIRLAGSDNTNDDVAFVGQGGITLSSSNNVNGGTITINGGSVTGTTYNLQVPANTTNIELQGATTNSNLNRVAIVGGTNVDVIRTANNILTINGTASSSIPSGTRMLFQQSNAPAGWTKVTSGVNNRALRLVTGNVGSGGGTNFSTALVSTRTAGGGSVNNHSLTVAQMPTHFHRIFNSSTNAGSHPRTSNIGANSYVARGTGAVNHNEGYNMRAAGNSASTGKTSNTGGNPAQGHSHGFTSPTFNLNVKYTDVIICTKN